MRPPPRLLAGRVRGLFPSYSHPRIQPPLQTSSIRHSSSSPPKSYYTLFPQTLPAGPPPNGPFTINLRTLRSEFLKLQQSTHPDLFPPQQRKIAETASAQLNKAYTTLCSPLLRAEYLLTLRGYQDPAEDETHKLSDHELLMDVLDANEILETATREEELVELREKNEERIRECIERLEGFFKEDRLDEVRGEVVRLKYWVNVAEGLKHWEPGKGVSLQH
ncbi:hypothetical protein TWF481_007377 [Arthrobotrys musiformis]|uniref:Co-chaperone HscB C-terminal oligomerisation domain-containing protein n=1 Tax=Arthrobotrys musiformis TaxID=47236 RepID=A0AAV9WC54_9PEZI